MHASARTVFPHRQQASFFSPPLRGALVRSFHATVHLCLFGFLASSWFCLCRVMVPPYSLYKTTAKHIACSLSLCDCACRRLGLAACSWSSVCTRAARRPGTRLPWSASNRCSSTLRRAEVKEVRRRMPLENVLLFVPVGLSWPAAGSSASF